ncbi:3-keto-disaccharide hydrolase [Limnoglobus roseus]|nr:DUF1080 domain-containing protein [Limnoglobus roseus]
MLSILVLTPALTARADDPAKKEEWKQLFNGKNLDGWTPKIKGFEYGDNYNDTFRVVDGVIQANYDKYTKFDENYGHLFYKDKFSNYRLRVEYRFTGQQVKGGPGWAQRNSGAMLHCQDPKTMGKDQLFPVSIEAQFLGGLGKGERPTGSMCSPGTNVVMNGKLITTHCINSKSKTYNGDQWVTIEMEVHGSGTIKHIVEGQTVIEYEKPQLDPKDMDGRKLIKDEKNLLLSEGYISLQAESHPVEFRKVEILILDK